jgi:galactokinase/mevalonate kinase-like predicted kinase
MSLSSVSSEADEISETYVEWCQATERIRSHCVPGRISVLNMVLDKGWKLEKNELGH